ncbi:MAG: Rne/Rng family ribonuclease [Gammaproteobacteria bacterium]
MLINAAHAEEVRVALVDGQRLYDLDIEHRAREQKKANVYKGRITRVEPSLEAAFVDFGAERHGFLPLKEIAREYFQKQGGEGRLNIKELIREGQEVIVQVEKEERGNKGAALSTFISLAGRYLVLMPNNPRAGGISRRIEGEERAELKQALSSLKLPEDMGVIIRTAGLGRAAEELQSDLDQLMEVWGKIKEATASRKAPFLAYQEGNVIVRALRDYLKEDIGEVLVDNEEAFNEAINFVRRFMPAFESRVKMYRDSVPLFNRYQIESQIETAYEREVKLPSGGAIVIDQTEALVSIDINSARATKGSDIEETAFNTNLEAADEIARQLRLRDIGGLIVIDFIDMSSVKNQREVENRVRDATESDRARIQLGRISRFGLMELSRQRLRPSLEETTTITCPRCSGLGTIRNVKSLALSVMRIIEEEVMKDKTGEIQAQLPVAVATYILNEKRPVLRDIESRYNVRILVIPNPNLETPHFDIQRIRSDKLAERGADVLSFEIAHNTGIVEAAVVGDDAQPVRRAEPAVKMVMPNMPAPAPQAAAPATAAAAPAAAAPGALAQLLAWLKALFGGAPQPVAAPQQPQRQQNAGQQRQGNRDGRGDRDNRGDRGGNDRNRGRGDRNRGPRQDRDQRGERGDRDQQPRGDRDQQRGGRDQQPRGDRDQQRGGRDQQPRDQQQPRGERPDRGERDQQPRGDRDQQRAGRDQQREPREAREPREPREPRADRPQQPRTPESDAQAGDDRNRQAPRRDRSTPPPPPARIEATVTGDLLETQAGMAGEEAAAPGEQREGGGGGRRRRHRSRRREREMERQQRREHPEGSEGVAEIAGDEGDGGAELPSTLFSADVAATGSAATEPATIAPAMSPAHPPATQQPLAAALHSPASEPVAYEAPVVAAQVAAQVTAHAAATPAAEEPAAVVEPATLVAATPVAVVTTSTPEAAVSAPAAAAAPADDGRPRRAANDPREIRRRQLEAERLAQQQASTSGSDTTPDNANV